MDQTITCECGAVYGPTDNYGIKRHKASKSHQKAMQQASEEKAFDQADRDAADEDGWDLDEPDATLQYPATFEELDESDAAKALTPYERSLLVSDIALTKGALDEKHNPRMFAERYVEHLALDTPSINKAILPDLRTYVEGVVVLLRKDAEGAEAPIPYEEDPRTEPSIARAPRKQTAKEKATSAKPKPVATSASGTKACRVCKIDKPLEDYRKKSSRPDGRDTICADCSKQWLVNHKAKAGAK